MEENVIPKGRGKKHGAGLCRESLAEKMECLPDISHAYAGPLPCAALFVEDAHMLEAHVAQPCSITNFKGIWHVGTDRKLHTEGMLLLELGLVSSNHSASLLVYVCKYEAKLFSQPKNRNRE